jgi:O-antigen/teichoic acid export membrane protein
VSFIFSLPIQSLALRSLFASKSSLNFINIDYSNYRFAVIQMLSLVVLQIDNLLINHTLGSSQVYFFSIFTKLYSLPYIIYSGVLTIQLIHFPVLVKLKNTLGMKLLLSEIYRSVFAVVILILTTYIFFGNYFVQYISKSQYRITFPLWILCFILIICFALDYPLTLFRNSFNPSINFLKVVICVSLFNIVISYIILVKTENPILLLIPNIFTLLFVNLPMNIKLLKSNLRGS